MLSYRGQVPSRTIISRGDTPIEARPGTQCAQAPDIKVEETEEAGTQHGVDSDGGLCPRNEIRTS